MEPLKGIDLYRAEGDATDASRVAKMVTSNEGGGLRGDGVSNTLEALREAKAVTTADIDVAAVGGIDRGPHHNAASEAALSWGHGGGRNRNRPMLN